MGRYWKCPNCGVVLDKGPGHEGKTTMYMSPFSRTHGTVTCGGCQSRFAVQDVYGGKYDVKLESNRRRQSQEPVRAGETKRDLLSWLGGVFGGQRKGKDSSPRTKKKTATRKSTRRIGHCCECYWYSNASLDGIYGKGICNYGSGQRPPFTMSPGDVLKIAWGKERGCEHFKTIDLRQKG